MNINETTGLVPGQRFWARLRALHKLHAAGVMRFVGPLDRNPRLVLAHADDDPDTEFELDLTAWRLEPMTDTGLNQAV